MDRKHTSKPLRWVLGVIGICLAMYVCASISYHAVRKKAPSQSESAYGIHKNNHFKEQSSKPFPNLPVALPGAYSPDENFTRDMNDYLVISEGNLVNLYAINPEGNKIFQKVLDIDPASLKAEDRALLESGILLGTKEALLSLIEDYSS
ncbi:MAG: BofC C-terminal domain-containing protein [Clostridia bacterium]|nr:BofC C-terminal domain-containing protein [Clostridia bacterium]